MITSSIQLFSEVHKEETTGHRIVNTYLICLCQGLWQLWQNLKIKTKILINWMVSKSTGKILLWLTIISVTNVLWPY